MKKLKQPKMTIFFAVLAISMFTYSLFTLYQSYTYIQYLITSGSLTLSESITDVIQYCMDNSMAYIFYGVAFVFFGYLITKVNTPQMIEPVVVNESIDDDWDEIDEFQITLKEKTDA